MTQIGICSDTKGKLKKIIEGVVFSDPYIFVTEFFQNSYRAKAKTVSVVLDSEEGTFRFSDDGKGLKRAEDILTLDYSSWDSTTEGFGIGFWSWAGFDIKADDESPTHNVECEVLSRKLHLKMDKLALLESMEPKADIRFLDESVDGFNVLLRSELFKDDETVQALRQRIISDGELMPYHVLLNGSLIPVKDVLKDVRGDHTLDFSNRLFDARLTLAESYEDASIYYEKRKVRDMYFGGFVKGVIELKPKALNLREPDRKDFSHDVKFHAFKDKVKECIKALYKSFVAQADANMINGYADAISRILDVKDYERFLQIDDVFLSQMAENDSPSLFQGNDFSMEALQELNQLISSIEETTVGYLWESEDISLDVQKVSRLLNEVTPLAQESWVSTGELDTEPEHWLQEKLTSDQIQDAERLVIKGRVWEKISKENLSDFARYDEDVTTSIGVEKPHKKRRKSAINDVLSKSRRKVWLKASEQDEYDELVAKAKYYHVKVFVAKNVLYENVFEARQIPHISEIKNGITKRNIIKNVELKTEKEKKFIQLLQPICSYYHLPYNTFLIGDLELYVETRLHDVVIDRSFQKNTKEKIEVYGVAEGNTIILDRRALALKRFNFSSVTDFGKNEFRALLASIKTISHELAHLLYGTTDGTIEHYQKEEQIMLEIEKHYNSLV